MGVKVKHVIGDNILNVQILTENPGGPFPKKIYANSMCTNDDDYLKALRADIDKLDVDGLLEILDAIESWCHYRNECIHSVMNKNVDSLGEEIAKKAEDGMTYARFIDSQVKLLKKKNLSRRALRLGNQ